MHVYTGSLSYIHVSEIEEPLPNHDLNLCETTSQPGLDPPCTVAHIDH